MKHKIDKYFENKGINVSFNTLGATDLLRHAFVSDYKSIVENSSTKRSNFVKPTIYSDMYTFQIRPKYTGFESYQKMDNEFRQKIAPYIYESQMTPGEQITNDSLNTTKSYKQLLVDHISKIENPLVYLSGGMDSHLLAYSFLEANKKFTPIIFEYVTDTGEVTNFNDIKYAFEFCKKYGLIPEIHQLNITELWAGEHFSRLAIEMQINSPQFTTYAFMVNMMSLKYPNASHLFGGEVRFSTEYFTNTNERANIVYLNKVVPSYDGGNFGLGVGCFTSVGVGLVYFSNGTWYINYFTSTPSSGLLTDGSWYAFLPSRTYEIRGILINAGSSGGTTSLQTSWQTIVVSGTTVASCTANGASFGGANSAFILFETELREVGQTIPGLFASVEIGCASICI